MEQIELHQAFMWDCPECGLENFIRAIRIELTQEEIDELSQSIGIEATVESRFSVIPKEVTCMHCATKFETENG